MNKIIINKNGILKINPIWISLNNEKYKLHFSNPIQLTSNQSKNTIKIRDWSFTHSKEFILNNNDSTMSLNIRLNRLERLLRAGIAMVSFSIILYIMLPWRFFPTSVLFYIFWGSIILSLILSIMFSRNKYVETTD